MKAYTPENLVKISRYKKLFPTLPAEVRHDVYSRMLVLLKEEEKWCDRGNYKHIAQILTTIALYEVLQMHGKSEPEAYRIISEAMWGALTPESYRKMARRSFFLPMMKKILPFGFRHGSGAGWQYTWHLEHLQRAEPDETGRDVLPFRRDQLREAALYGFQEDENPLPGRGLLRL